MTDERHKSHEGRKEGRHRWDRAQDDQKESEGRPCVKSPRLSKKGGVKKICLAPNYDAASEANYCGSIISGSREGGEDDERPGGRTGRGSD